VEITKIKKSGLELRSPGLFGKWPVIGLLMFVLGGLSFAGLTYNLAAHGPLLRWDTAIASTWPGIALRSPAFVETIMNAGFYLGREVTVIVNILLIIYFVYKRFWQEFTMLVVGWAGTAVLFFVLTDWINRPRPPTQIWIVLSIPGFPSGHSISVVACFGFLAYLLAPKMPSLFWKILVIVAALFLMVFVGFSRVFTGGHYLTDVLAGYAVGIAWVGLAYTVIEMYYQKRKKKVFR